MPTLHWIGKEKIISHHQEVPYRVLNHQYGFTEEGEQLHFTRSGNKIIHGDNLEALKSLLPQYEGKIKCIYIDPPYNTGNEGWVYNDNVNDPKIKEWLEKTLNARANGRIAFVGADDLTRQDKWLCMMYPRLQLLHKLLSEDGAIFVSIDDNEIANLRLVMDEIFGKHNFISNIVWRRRKSQANLSKNISPIHDFILCYSRSGKTVLNKIAANLNEQHYKNPDNDERGPYVTMPSTNKGGAVYDITTPTGKVITAEWRFKEETYRRLLNDNRLVFPKSGNGKPRYKLFLREKLEDGVTANTWWDEEASNQEAGAELVQIFGEKIFDTPKPSKLVSKIISLVTGKDSIILDSFAGSGTTAHAVLNLNKQDGGQRRFILVEIEDYANTITAERVKRVIRGYGDTEGTGGSFDYYTLGETLFDEDDNLNANIDLRTMCEYIWYSETRSPLPNHDPGTAYLGKHNGTGYYFMYSKEAYTTLDYEALAGLVQEKADRYVIYADNCLLDESFTIARNIEFKKIPRDISRL